MIGNPLLSGMLSAIAGLMLMLLPAAAQATSLSTEFEQGVIAYQTGDYRQALEAFSQTLAQDAEHSAAYSNRCLTYMQLEVQACASLFHNYNQKKYWKLHFKLIVLPLIEAGIFSIKS